MKVQQSSFANVVKELLLKKSYNAFLFYGNEPALIAEYVFGIRTALKSTHDFVKISHEDSNYLAFASAELFTQSMFGERKVVYIENYKKADYRKLAEILEKITNNEENILILSQDSTLEQTNSIRKLCENTSHFATIGVYAETPTAIKMQLKTLLEEKSIGFTQDLLEYLSERINPVLILGEIAKIETFLLSQSEKVLTKVVIDVLVSQNTDANIFELPTVIFEKNAAEALVMLGKMQTSGEDPFPIFFAIQSYVKKLYAMQNALSMQESLDTLLKIHAIHFSQVGTVKKHLQQYGIREITTILGKINTLERNIRFGNEFAFNCIKSFVMNLCS